MKSIRTKLLLSYTVMLIIFLVIGSMVAYSISKRVYAKTIRISEENEAVVFVDYMEDMIEDAHEAIEIISVDIQKNESIEKLKTIDYVYDKVILNEIFQYFRYAIHTNDFFSSIHYISNDAHIGYSTNETIYEKGDLTISHQLSFPDEEIVQVLAQIIGVDKSLADQLLIIKEVESENKKTYVVGVLDYGAIVGIKEQELNMVNRNGDIFYSTSTNEDINDNAINMAQKMNQEKVTSTYLHNDLYTAISDDSNIIYVIINNQTQNNQAYKIILYRQIGLMIIIAILFLFLGKYYIDKILRPIDTFDNILNNIKQFEGNKSIDKYIELYSTNRSIHREVFMLYSMIVVAVILAISSLILLSKPMIEQCSDETYDSIIEQISINTQTKLNTYINNVKHIILDEDIQKAMLNASENSEGSINVTDTIYSMNINRKGINNVKIFSGNGKEIFNNDTYDNDIKQIISEFTNRGVDFRIEIDQRAKKHIILSNNVKLLSQYGAESNALESIGWVEMEIEEFLGEKLNILYSQTAITSYIIDDHDNILAISGNIKYQTKTIKDEIYALDLSEEKHRKIDYQNEKILMLSHQIKDTPWNVIALIQLDNYRQQSIDILLNNLYLILILIMVSAVLSKVLGDNILHSIDDLIVQIEGIDNEFKSNIEFSKKKYEHEYIKLANSFDRMLKRLDLLSKQLTQKETENNELEKRRNQTMLLALQAQIKPHFLHNIITSIVLLIKSNRLDDAVNMLVATGKFFKSGLYGTDDFIALKDEILHVEHFVELQKIRFRDKISFINHIPDIYNMCKVPKFILQPIVENAIEHGMKKGEKLLIEIGYCVNDEDIEIKIIDNGKGMDENEIVDLKQNISHMSSSEHYGLFNINERLQLWFGKEYGVRIENNDGGGLIVSVKLPYIKKI